MGKSNNAPPEILLLGGDGGLSGVPRHLNHLAETLSGQAKVTVASDRNRGGFDDMLRAGVRHLEINGLQTSLSPRRLLNGWRGLLRLVRQPQWNLVWAHARIPVLFLQMMLALRLWRPAKGTCIAITFHGLPFGPGHFRLTSVFSQYLERLLLLACPSLHLVCLTLPMAERLQRRMGARAMARHQVHVLPNSSSLGALPEPAQLERVEPRRELVMTGRVGHQKNNLRAAELLDHMPTDYFLTFCGAGTDRGDFQASIRKQVRPDTYARIRFAGEVQDILPVLARADCYLLTSRYEGLPIGALEAFEAGLPVVLSQIECAPDIIMAHPLALSVPFEDLSEDAARICTLIDTYLQDRSCHAREIHAAWQQHFSYTTWQKQLRQLMPRLLAT